MYADFIRSHDPLVSQHGRTDSTSPCPEMKMAALRKSKNANTAAYWGAHTSTRTGCEVSMSRRSVYTTSLKACGAPSPSSRTLSRNEYWNSSRRCCKGAGARTRDEKCRYLYRSCIFSTHQARQHSRKNCAKATRSVKGASYDTQLRSRGAAHHCDP